MKFLSSRPPEAFYVYAEGFGEDVKITFVENHYCSSMSFSLDEAKQLYTILVHTIAEAQRRSEMKDPNV